MKGGRRHELEEKQAGGLPWRQAPGLGGDVVDFLLGRAAAPDAAGAEAEKPHAEEKEVMSLAEIMEDRAGLLAACHELAALLEERAGQIEQGAQGGGGPGLDGLWRLLPLMCAFASPAKMRACAARLRAVAARLERLPATVGDLAELLAGSAEGWEALETLLLDGEGGAA